MEASQQIRCSQVRKELVGKRGLLFQPFSSGSSGGGGDRFEVKGAICTSNHNLCASRRAGIHRNQYPEKSDIPPRQLDLFFLFALSRLQIAFTYQYTHWRN